MSEPGFCTNCDDYSEDPLIPLPCRCLWCSTCITTSFTLARAEEHYPPRCCSKLNFTNLKKYLSADLIADLETKFPVYETPGHLRVFCAHKNCLKFIPISGLDGDIATCPSCSQKTCKKCKDVYHEGECGVDQNLQKTLELCKDENYKQCKSCGEMVERNGGQGRSEGCPHMKCPCGYKFCAHCGGNEWHWNKCLEKK